MLHISPVPFALLPAPADAAHAHSGMVRFLLMTLSFAGRLATLARAAIPHAAELRHLAASSAGSTKTCTACAGGSGREPAPDGYTARLWAPLDVLARLVSVLSMARQGLGTWANIFRKDSNTTARLRVRRSRAGTGPPSSCTQARAANELRCPLFRPCCAQALICVLYRPIARAFGLVPIPGESETIAEARAAAYSTLVKVGLATARANRHHAHLTAWVPRLSRSHSLFATWYQHPPPHPPSPFPSPLSALRAPHLFSTPTPTPLPTWSRRSGCSSRTLPPLPRQPLPRALRRSCPSPLTNKSSSALRPPCARPFDLSVLSFRFGAACTFVPSVSRPTPRRGVLLCPAQCSCGLAHGARRAVVMA